MGGYGSTRWGSVRTRTTTGQCYRLRVRDVRDALRAVEGDPAARAGRRMTLTWRSGDGLELASVGADVMRLDGDLDLVLQYSVLREGEPREPIRERVPLAYHQQRGATTGRRWWLVCPGCGRRCGALYLAPGRTRWRCRTCEHLTYPSCNESDARVSRAARAIAQGAGLGDVAGMSVTALGVALMAHRLYKRRLARALQRDLGKREYRRHYQWLERV